MADFRCDKNAAKTSQLRSGLDGQRAEIEFEGVEIRAEDSTLRQQGKARVKGVNQIKIYRRKSRPRH